VEKAFNTSYSLKIYHLACGHGFGTDAGFEEPICGRIRTPKNPQKLHSQTPDGAVENLI